MNTTLVPLLHHLRLLAASHSPDGDAALLERFAHRRDESAFAELMARHGPMVWRVCRRVLFDAHAAEDAFQATFLVLARRAGDIRQPSRLTGWLYGVALRVARKARSNGYRSRIRHAAAKRDELPAPGRGPEAEAIGRELLDALEEELERLPEAYRLPLILCALDGRSQEEAAQRLGWSPGSVKGRLERGRKRLHERLVQRGFSLAAAQAAAEASRASAGAVAVPLTAATARAALALASGTATGSGNSAGAVALADGIGTCGTVRRTVITALLAVGLIVALGIWAWSALSEEPPPDQSPIAHGAAEHGVEQKAEQRAAQLPAPPAPPVVPLPKLRPALEKVNVTGGKNSWQFDGADAIAFSKDGKVLAAAYTDMAGTVRLWDVPSGKEIASFKGGETIGCSVALSPDGKTVARGEMEILVWDVPSGNKKSLGPSGGSFSAVLFSPDGKILATGGNNIVLWDAITCKKITTLGKGGSRLAFSPDGKTLAAGPEIELGGFQEPTITLWDVASGKNTAVLKEDQEVRALTFSPNGKILAVSGNQTIRLWDMTTDKYWDPATGKPLGLLASLKGTPSMYTAVRCLAFSPDGKVLAAGNSVTVDFFAMPGGKHLTAFAAHPVAVKSLAFSPDGKLLATASSFEDNSPVVKLWDLLDAAKVRPPQAKGASLRLFEGHMANVAAVALSPDGKFALSGGGMSPVYDFTMRLWDVATGKELRRFGDFNGPVTSVAFSQDGKQALSASEDTTLRLWDVTTGKELRRFEVMPVKAQCFSAAALSPDGKWIETCSRHSYDCYLWDVAGTQLLREFRFDNNDYHKTHAVAFSSDSQRMLSGGENGNVYLWDLTAAKPLRVFKGHTGPVTSVQFSPDGKRALSGAEDGTLRLWDLATGKEIRKFEGHEAAVYAAGFSPDGTQVLSCSNDKTLRLWDAENGKELHRFLGHTSAVSSAVWSRDGQHILSGDASGVMRLWIVPK